MRLQYPAQHCIFPYSHHCKVCILCQTLSIFGGKMKTEMEFPHYLQTFLVGPSIPHVNSKLE